MHSHTLMYLFSYTSTRYGDGGAGVAMLVVAMAVVMAIVVLMMSDDSQGPWIGPSFIIFAFLAIKKKTRNGPTDRRMDGLRFATKNGVVALNLLFS